MQLHHFSPGEEQTGLRNTSLKSGWNSTMAEEQPQQKHTGNVVNGLPVPAFVTQAHIDSLKGIELFPDDTMGSDLS